jgi:hypothetical protein
MSVDSSQHKKWVIFLITQRVSDLLAGTKDQLAADTKTVFVVVSFPWLTHL